MAASHCVVAGTLRDSLNVVLLSPHADFIARLAGVSGRQRRAPFGKDGARTYSSVVEQLIDHFDQTVSEAPSGPIKQVRGHFSVSVRYVDYVNTWAVRWGVGRSEAMRRIIDHAMKSDFRTEAVTPRAA